MKLKRIPIILASSLLLLSTVASAAWLIISDITIQNNISNDNNINKVPTRNLKIYDGIQSMPQLREAEVGDNLLHYIKTDPAKIGYYFDGWYKESTFENRVDESQTIQASSTDLCLYAKHIKKDPTLNNEVKPNTSGTTTINPPAPSGPKESYIDVPVISNNSSVDVKFDANEPSKGTSHAPDGNNASGLTKFPGESSATNIIKLQQDLIIEKGSTLNIGAKLGYTTATGGSGQYNGAISGAFTMLDLNGHNLIVRGTFNACGVVKNSRPSRGLVYVEKGGLIFTPFVVLDFRGGGLLFNYYSNAYAPFTEYCIPYLDTTVIMEAGSIMNCGASLCATGTSLKGENFYTEVKLIGPVNPNDNSFLQLDKGYIIKEQNCTLNNNLTPYETISNNIDNFKPSIYRETMKFCKNIDTSKYILPDCINYVENNDNSNCNLDVKVLSMELKGVSAQMDSVEFPISSFVDLGFYDMNIKLHQPFDFLPRSSAYVDSQSCVIFDRSSAKGKTNVVASLSTKDILRPEVRHIPNFGLRDNILNDMKYNYTKPATITIDGDIQFNANSNTGKLGVYKLGGYINLSQKALTSIKNNLSKIYIGGTGVSLCGTAIGNALTRKYISAGVRMFSLPLISASNDNKLIGRVKIGNSLIDGEYNPNTGVVTAGNKSYSFIPDQITFRPEKRQTGRTPAIPKEANIDNRLGNVVGNWVECTYNTTTHIIKANNSYYAFYSGGYIKVKQDATTVDVFTKEINYGTSWRPNIYNHWKFDKYLFERNTESTKLTFNNSTGRWTYV